MGKKKGTKGPKRPPRPPKPYRAGLALAATLALPGCGNDYVEQAIDCGDLAIHIADHLYLSDNGLECGLGPETVGMIIDFGVACIGGAPDGPELVGCLDALYSLTECPETLPSECLLF